ncbi:MAG: hypothetical protein WCP55_25675 [Lentisphaerota bacterium]
MKYWIKEIIFALFLPLIYLTDFLAQIGAGALSTDKPKLNFKNILSLWGFILISQLIILIIPIQRAHIKHLQEKMRDRKQSEQNRFW